VRDYVKWDYQPTSIEGVPESFARAYSIMTTEPQGPVYMCYDAALQEAPLTQDVPLPPAGMVATPARMAPDPAAIAAIADKLIKAEHPLLLAEYAGRRAGGFDSIVELAETTGAAVWDVNNALNFPNKHPLCLSMDKDTLRHTDLSSASTSRLGEAAHRAQQRQAHARAAHAAVVRFRRDRFRRDQHQQVGVRLLPHAAVLGAGAGRHRARHPRAHPHLQAAHRR
jgi:Thiamine pyrophosphate-requiring enzymes [acetolactate synthase, pyruvate dehydrogenase (cytochrome), glyoxylate carboligase, phosphonopyruvate decarboxylase]